MQKLAAQQHLSKERHVEHAYKHIVCAHEQLEGFLLRKECELDKNAKQMTKETLSIAICHNALEHNAITKCIEQCIRLFLMHSSCLLEGEKLESVNILYNAQKCASLRLLHFVEYLERSLVDSLPLTIVLLVSRSLKNFDIFDAITYLEKNITVNLYHSHSVCEYSTNDFNKHERSKHEDNNSNKGNISKENFVNTKSSSEKKFTKNNVSYELDKLKMIVELYVSYCAKANKACTVVDENEKTLVDLYGSDILQHLSSMFLQQKSIMSRQEKIKVVTPTQKNSNTKIEPEYKSEQSRSVTAAHGTSLVMKSSATKFFHEFVLTKRLLDVYNYLCIKGKSRQIFRIIAYIIIIVAAQFVLRMSVKSLFSERSVLVKSPTLSLAKSRRRQLALETQEIHEDVRESTSSK